MKNQRALIDTVGPDAEHRDARYLEIKIWDNSSRRLSRFWLKEHARRKRLLLT